MRASYCVTTTVWRLVSISQIFLRNSAFKTRSLSKKQFFLFLAKFWGISRQIKKSKHRQWLKKFEDACKLLSDNNSVKTRVNQSDFFEKLRFQDKIFIKVESGRLTRVFTITRMRLRTFSVIVDVYFTLFALKSPQNFARNKKNCIFVKDLILKAEFLKKIWLSHCHSLAWR